jgi:phosphate transport system ATP-binding protein
MCDLTFGACPEGEILLDGKNIFAPDINTTELRRRVGMVFDTPTPLPMSIFDNVALGPRMNKINNRAAVAEEVEKALRMSALWDEVKDRLDTSAMRL